MNCYRCGEDREAAGYICQACLDECREEEQTMIGRGAIDKERKGSGDMSLSPREAIVAMLDGATLITPNGWKVRWIEDEGVFADIEENNPRDCFKGFRYSSQKETRPMGTFECLAWANSPDSFGWMVSIKNYDGDDCWGDWDIPQRFHYDGMEKNIDCFNISYRRARVLPDNSGIDESTIQGLIAEGGA